MAHEIIDPWPIEIIPDADYLFLRVHQNVIDDQGRPTAGAFRNTPKDSGMSVDWGKYRTSIETRSNGKQETEKYAVIRFTAGDVRTIKDQTVVHEPLADNRAHTEVFGTKDTEVRERFMAIYEVEIALSASTD